MVPWLELDLVVLQLELLPEVLEEVPEEQVWYQVDLELNLINLEKVGSFEKVDSIAT